MGHKKVKRKTDFDSDFFESIFNLRFSEFNDFCLEKYFCKNGKSGNSNGIRSCRIRGGFHATIRWYEQNFKKYFFLEFRDFLYGNYVF